ncbi:hypothetical protein ES319_A10G051700v1 [Gossypium barbadense]|uniref:Uncharacterized protein n=2 Tax=Gossypium barbadense TaxID=3634 RepID=A0A5J5U0J9_GOSBA|nr:hypothetical protein ES319_A10G051700v1 [Gossypium barbadense]
MTLVPGQSTLHSHRLHRIWHSIIPAPKSLSSQTFQANVCAAPFTIRGPKSESPSTISRRKPIAPAKSRALSHARASATKASTTSLKREKMLAKRILQLIKA